VHEDIKEDLVKEIRKNITKIYGEDPRKSPALPRMVNLKHFSRIISLIDPEKVVAGGGHSKVDLYVEPTILDRVEADDPVMQEEVFGPVMPILTYKDLGQLIRKLKVQPAPLVVYIFTGNIRMAKKIIREIPSGGGMINEVVLLFINMNSPFGGLGESGMGSYHGKAGFEAFSHYKTILNKPTWFELFLKYPPYRNSNLRLLRSVLGNSIRNFWH